MKPFCIDWDEFKDTKLCNAWVATAIVGAAVVGAGATIYGAEKAADAQTAGFDKANTIAQDQYTLTRKDLSPYRTSGDKALTELEDRLPFLTSPIELTQEWLESTPGYKFSLDQGLKSAQNSAAVRGLGVSGAALKGATTFATGLADSTYKTQFDVENTNRKNAYDRLKGLVDVGQNAAAQTGIAGTAAANTSASAAGATGNAQAAAANTTGSAISGASNQIGGYLGYRGLYGGSVAPAYGSDNGVGVYSSNQFNPIDAKAY